MKDLKSYLTKNKVLCFDGAMTTVLAVRQQQIPEHPETLNKSHPDLISGILQDYVEANADAIRTYTFGLSAMMEEGLTRQALSLIEPACRNAEKAGASIIFASIGPCLSGQHQIYIEQARVFLEQGMRCFLFETMAEAEEALKAAEWIKQQCPDAFILISFAVGPEGVSDAGLQMQDLIRQADVCSAIDAIALNCRSGPLHMKQHLESLELPDKPFGMMPNAGYPTVLGWKVAYQGSPEYFAGEMLQIRLHGVSILGGCCGTTSSHIAALTSGLQSLPEQIAPVRTIKESPAPLEKAVLPDFLIAAELDPPKTDALQPFASYVRRLSQAGADWITLADCPIGRSRADSSLLASLLHHEYGIDLLPHMTCRDRNLNATKALLLGLAMSGIRQVLIVTGDPLPAAFRDEVKSVYNFNSRKLLRFADSLNKNELANPLNLFAALNLNAPNFEQQLKLAIEKEEAGACGFLTQPVLSKRAFDNLKKARAVLKGRILGGIYPVVTWKNAQFLNNEIYGMDIDEQIVSLYEGKNRQEGEELAVRISKEVMRQIRPYVDGYYLMTPFNRISLMESLIGCAKKLRDPSSV